MSDTDPAIIGVQSCGCVTLAIARPKGLRREDKQEISEIVERGGQVITTTVGDARARPNFLPFECPHEPKGWVPA